MSRQPQDVPGEHFRDAQGDWVADPDLEAVDVAAAWMQYRAAKLVWEALDANRLSIRDVARALGGGPESHRRKLAGEQAATLRDVCGWLALCDATGQVRIEVATLLPASYQQLISPSWRPGEHTLPAFGRTTPTEVDWSSIAEDVHVQCAKDIRSSMSTLLTSEVLLHRVCGALTLRGLDPKRLRRATLDPLRGTGRSSAAATVQFGSIVSPTTLSAIVVDEDWARTSENASRALNAIRDVVLPQNPDPDTPPSSDDTAATPKTDVSGHPHFVVLCTTPASEHILGDALPDAVTQTVGTEWTIGPLPPVGDDEPESPWQHAAVQVRAEARAGDSNVGIHVLQVLKATTT